LGGSSPGRVVNSCLPLIYTLEKKAMQEVPAWPSELRYTVYYFADISLMTGGYVALIRRRCLDCGQVRIDKEYA
jgi:hypothetical protein